MTYKMIQFHSMSYIEGLAARRAHELRSPFTSALTEIMVTYCGFSLLAKTSRLFFAQCCWPHMMSTSACRFDLRLPASPCRMDRRATKLERKRARFSGSRKMTRRFILYTISMQSVMVACEM